MKNVIKKIIVILILLFFCFGLTACNNNEKTIEETTEGTNNMTAEKIVNKFKEKNSNIGKVVVYTEETDLNNLLGRPNQYTSKVTFEDIRLEQVNADNEFLSEEEQNEPTGGTIEVFENEEDMKSRKDYIETISSSGSIFAQYIYSKGNVLLRLEKELTPDQAKEYEDLLNEIVK